MIGRAATAIDLLSDRLQSTYSSQRANMFALM